MRIADVNVYTYTVLADNARGEEKEAYKKIAKRWLLHSEGWRVFSGKRCDSLICCMWSFLFSGITILLAFSEIYWTIPFVIASILLMLAFLIHVFPSIAPIVEKINTFKGVLDPYPSHNNWVIELIEDHDWLEEIRGQKEI